MQSKVAILGFRGVGKSTVSKLLNKMTGLPLCILDSSIEKKEGKSISQIVKEHGWNHFRDLELDYLKSQVERERVIVDCGGGILEGHNGEFSIEKSEIFKSNFFCIYLSLPDAKLLTRLKNMQNKSSRPGLQGDIKEILTKRKPWFEKIANVEINTDGLSALDVANQIRKKIG